MRVLSIDTSTHVASVAVVDEQKVYCEINAFSKNTNHSERLMVLIDEALNNSDLQLDDIDCFSCSVGPGSFTGLRIAISTVKGLAQSKGKAVVGASTLESLAYNMPFADGLLCPVMDAQRDQLYTCLYKWRGGKLDKLEQEAVCTVERLMEYLKSRDENVILLGDGIKKIPDYLFEQSTTVLKAPVSCRMPKGSSLGTLSLDLVKEGKAMGYWQLEPNYMRKSQAEVQLEKKLGKRV